MDAPAPRRKTITFLHVAGLDHPDPAVGKRVYLSGTAVCEESEGDWAVVGEVAEFEVRDPDGRDVSRLLPAAELRRLRHEFTERCLERARSR